MGAMAPHFSLLPVPAGGVPVNAAIVATQHYGWTVRVLDAQREVPTTLESLGDFGAGPGYVLVRPVGTWPAGRTLELVATTQSLSPPTTSRHTFRAGDGPSHQPPSCAWTAPIAPGPSAPTMPAGLWPTNMPYRPQPNERRFVIPAVASACGYVVAARVCLAEKRQTLVYAGALAPGPAAEISLAPRVGATIDDAARIVGLELVDLAGHVARYGSMPAT